MVKIPATFIEDLGLLGGFNYVSMLLLRGENVDSVQLVDRFPFPSRIA